MLKRPIISEKTMKLAGTAVYTFEVGKDATKPGVAKLVAEMFKVSVLSVRMANIKGKVKMQRRARKSYSMPTVKKAIVTIKKGQSIPLFESPKEIEEEVVVTRGEEAEPMPQVKEKRGLLGLGKSKVKIEKGGTHAAPTTQRKVITGK